MRRSSPKAVKTSRSATRSGLQPLSPRLAAAPTGVPIDLLAFEDDHRTGKRSHPGNLGLHDLCAYGGIVGRAGPQVDPLPDHAKRVARGGQQRAAADQSQCRDVTPDGRGAAQTMH